MVKDCSDCTICRFNQLYVLGHDARLTRSTSTVFTPPSTMESNNANEVNRFLRIVTIGCWVPAFPFLLAHGIVTNTVCPVLGIVPMTFSAITALVHLTGGAKHRIPNIVVDLFCGTFLIGVLIPSWIMLSDGWRGDRGVVMVGTYGTVPMMINFVLHTWFVLREIELRNPFVWSRCPHCHGDLTHHKTPSHRAMSHVSSDSKESYEPVTMVDADEAAPAEGPSSYNHHEQSQPRPSTDDETARLV
ncbi:hypothetical protein PRZ48_014202 [Zasmidium cellare]|uniref:Uncharacterized protein n=1 Tax=Zasmidium cellare TaxID=395010 RepID=A0ABR0E0X5_ZASCE|nr:hypothetical protein PRZ48_014202 [Zasmidium cellare]